MSSTTMLPNVFVPRALAVATTYHAVPSSAACVSQ